MDAFFSTSWELILDFPEVAKEILVKHEYGNLLSVGGKPSYSRYIAAVSVAASTPIKEGSKF